jgi:hypothetical protein
LKRGKRLQKERARAAGGGCRHQAGAHLYDVALEVHEGAVEGEEANHFVAVVVVVADVAMGKMRELKGGEGAWGRECDGKKGRKLK